MGCSGMTRHAEITASVDAGPGGFAAVVAGWSPTASTFRCAPHALWGTLVVAGSYC